MAEKVIAEIRHILQDILVPDFKALTVNVDGIQHQIELSERSMGAQFDAMRAEMTAFRAEMSAFRAEMRAEFPGQRNLLHNQVLREIRPIRTLAAQSAHS